MHPLGQFLSVVAFLAFAGVFGFEVWSAEQCRYTQECAGYRSTHQEPAELTHAGRVLTRRMHGKRRPSRSGPFVSAGIVRRRRAGLSTWMQ